MADNQKSFLEKNFPSIFKGGDGKSLTGKKVRNISETTKEAKAIRERENRVLHEGLEVKQVSQVKGYQPSTVTLPIADLLPIESKIRVKKRNLRYIFFMIAMLIIGATVLLRTFITVGLSEVKSQYEESNKAVAQQQQTNAKYAPLESYLQQIQARNGASQAVNKLLPPFSQVLNGLETTASGSGISLLTYNITSKSETGSGPATGQSGSANPDQNSLQGSCGPLNNPYDKNSIPALGCLEATFTGDAGQAANFGNNLATLPYLVEVYVRLSDSSSTSGSSGSQTSGSTYTVTAAIINQQQTAAGNPEQTPEQLENELIQDEQIIENTPREVPTQ